MTPLIDRGLRAAVPVAIAVCLLALTALAPPPGRTVLAAEPATPHLAQPDAVCRGCHQQIYDAYRKTSMAQGSGLASDGLTPAELAASPFLHVPSGVTYTLTNAHGGPLLHYARATGPALDGDRQLRYFIGSGHRGRTFLYQQDSLWFETPINWYGKKQRWDMAPAYEETLQMPAPLPVDANCLHCHASQVQPPDSGVRNHFADTPFRAGGIGCASCHGDPSAHLARTASGRPGPILNPDTLDPTRRDSVCLQCHLEGDAAVYRPGKTLAGFVAGADLSDTAVYFVDRNRARDGGRASSQYEALLRSACKRATGAALTCTTCHDPHSSPSTEERVGYFRAKCLACHTGEAFAVRHHPEQQDCATCHMPTRRTLDISHEQSTDHDIEARPRTDFVATPGVRDLVPVGNVQASGRELGLAYAQLAQHGDVQSGRRALALLEAAAAAGADDPELHDQLGFLLQVSGSPALAAAQYRAALQQKPQDTTAAANLAVLRAGSGDLAQAVLLLRQVVRDDPSQTAAGLNLALLECRMGHKDEARAAVERMLVFHPDDPAAHRFLEHGNYAGQACPLH